MISGKYVWHKLKHIDHMSGPWPPPGSDVDKKNNNVFMKRKTLSITYAFAMKWNDNFWNPASNSLSQVQKEEYLSDLKGPPPDSNSRCRPVMHLSTLERGEPRKRVLTPAETPTEMLTIPAASTVVFCISKGVHVVLIGHVIISVMLPPHMKPAQTPTQTPGKSDADARPVVRSARMAKVLSAKGCMVYGFCRVVCMVWIC